jgi:hypothetical protein
MAKRWPQIRAVLITLHIATVILAAVPYPYGIALPNYWQRPNIRVELETWAHRLGVAPDVLQERAERVGRSWIGTRTRLYSYIEPYHRLIGAAQFWAMFSAPNRFPLRYFIETREQAYADDEAGWEVAYESRSPEAAWRRTFFDRERVRGLVNRYGRDPYQPQADQACMRLARDLFRERPAAVEVRCRYLRVPLPSWDEANRGEQKPGEWVYSTLVERKEVAAR